MTRHTAGFGTLLALLAAPAFADVNGSRDPAFIRFPLARWLTEPRRQHFHWTVIVPPAELSTHQRMVLRVVARIDGKDIGREAARREASELVGLIQYTDSAGHTWQNHVSVDADTLRSAAGSQTLDISFYAFVLPGDYTISLAVCDPRTLAHSVTVRKAHVATLKNDPLPALEAGLPAVEPIPGELKPPDIWYLPEVEAALRPALATKGRVHVQLLINATPTSRAEASAATQRDNMSLLIPALKILSQLQVNGTVDAALLDLTRRRVAFEQTDIHTLDWDRLRRYFLEARPGIIDIHTLADRGKMLNFFRDEVKRRLTPRGDGAAQIVIVLSGPAFFEDQETVEAPVEGLEPGRRLIYIRYRPVTFPRQYPRMRPTTRAGRLAQVTLPPDPEAPVPSMREDDLERTGELLGARLFDAGSAWQFRRILAATLEQLSRL